MRRVIDAPVEVVYAAWTDPALLRLWLAPGDATVVRAVAEPESSAGRFSSTCGESDGRKWLVRGRFQGGRALSSAGSFLVLGGHGISKHSSPSVFEPDDDRQDVPDADALAVSRRTRPVTSTCGAGTGVSRSWRRCGRDEAEMRRASAS